MNRIYLIKNLSSWMVDELLAFSQFVDFKLILLRKPPQLFNKQIDELKAKGVEIFIKPFRNIPDFNRTVFSLKFIIKNLPNFFGFKNFVFGLKSLYWFIILEEDIINNSTSIHAQFATQASIMAMLHKIYYEDSCYYFTVHAYDIYFTNRWIKSLVRGSEKVFSISNYAKSHLMEKFSIIDSEKIVVSRLGTFFKPNNFNFRKKPKDSLTLGFIGRLVEEKNIFFLLNVIKNLSENFSSIKVLVAGSGPLYKRVEKYLRRNNLRNIILLGFIYGEKKEDFFNEIDIIVLTSVSEGLPVVLIEALSYGIPILAPRIAAIPEICIDQFNGFLFPVKDAETLSHAIIDLYYMDSQNFYHYKLNAYNSNKEYDIIINSESKLRMMRWL